MLGCQEGYLRSPHIHSLSSCVEGRGHWTARLPKGWTGRVPLHAVLQGHLLFLPAWGSDSLGWMLDPGRVAGWHRLGMGASTQPWSVEATWEMWFALGGDTVAPPAPVLGAATATPHLLTTHRDHSCNYTCCFANSPYPLLMP